MKKEEFLNSIAEILAVDSEILKNATPDLIFLNDFDDWDSIAFLEISVLFENQLRIFLNPEDIRSLITLKDLLDLGKFV
ncbi:TPA: acyl carrier protein [Campylobacter jejuni]|uniref:acyl carrier protein n=1 Tax=Campylobacter jejuni TaxID=197 RepID=UPI000F7FB7A7|nr:acyl carrier protein [Campylobacter jejuni]EFP2985279.1 acyl carrier protein [Campylobacter jejuni]RTJ66523.1 acyl carrier protein [Campylobacter jejuni]HDZ4294090.1 acyl carrier protein [Campylobacter jejuni]HEC1683303.1 acyl carrier protein [Campylobacter jejuni]HEC2322771.1 acyl carrier protein [Campylobacter jejuni]